VPVRLVVLINRKMMRGCHRVAFWLGLFYIPIVLISVSLYMFPSFQREVLFLNNLRWPLPSSKFVDLDYTFGRSDVDKYNIQNVEVVSLRSSDDPDELPITLKGYKVSPPLDLKQNLKPFIEQKILPKSPVILFFHGNGSSRALSWRRRHIMNLADANAIVYAFDLRGYGDVSGRPTQRGVLQDSLAIYDFIRRNKEENEGRNIFIYGHSLGTAIASQLAHAICGGLAGAEGCVDDKHDVLISGLILDSPFVNASIAALHHPTTLPIRLLIPFATELILDGLEDKFQTDKFLSEIDVPVFIIQGDSDDEIPPNKAGGIVLEQVLVRTRGIDRKSRPAKVVKGLGEASVQRLEVKDANHENVHEMVGFSNLIFEFMEQCGMNYNCIYSRKSGRI
jgi:pimeloyl-ACP methyl ester carboxylesterase